MQTVIGIDPGSGGGIAIYKKNRLHQAIKMPAGLTEMKRYFDFIKENNDDVIVFIEKVQMFMSDSDEENKGMQFRIKSLLSNYDQLKSLIVFYGFQFVEVYPQTWQKELGLSMRGVEKTIRKNIYKDTAGFCFPEANITLHTADALLILKFGLNMLNHNPIWVAEKVQNTKTKNLFT